jgi:hypothetical protein
MRGWPYKFVMAVVVCPVKEWRSSSGSIWPFRHSSSAACVRFGKAMIRVVSVLVVPISPFRLTARSTYSPPSGSRCRHARAHTSPERIPVVANTMNRAAYFSAPRVTILNECNT